MAWTKLAAVSVAAMGLIAAATTSATSAHEGYYAGFLSGHQVVPPMASAGTGTVSAFYNESVGTLVVKFDFRGLTHGAKSVGLWAGWAGRNGLEQFSLDYAVSYGDSHTSGEGECTMKLSAKQVELLEARKMYVLVGDELRAQLVPAVPGTKTFFAPLSGAITNPPTKSTAIGGLMLEVLPTGSMIVTGSWQALKSAQGRNLAEGKHFHIGLTGTNGQRVFELQPTLRDNCTVAFYTADKNIYRPTAELLDNLVGRGIYMDVHSNH